ncbi:MAG: hypothetical protein EAZ21_02175 [Betaproteobacteria bacterium]|nr:MAG: hypothetical protein EAZ21_02175 [Betaproteobacteria bacterium]
MAALSAVSRNQLTQHQNALSSSRHRSNDGSRRSSQSPPRAGFCIFAFATIAATIKKQTG